MTTFPLTAQGQDAGQNFWHFAHPSAPYHGIVVVYQKGRDVSVNLIPCAHRRIPSAARMIGETLIAAAEFAESLLTNSAQPAAGQPLNPATEAPTSSDSDALNLLGQDPRANLEEIEPETAQASPVHVGLEVANAR